MSSTNPTRKSSVLPPNMISDVRVIGTKRTNEPSVARNIAAPPSIAVGRLCHRSDFGRATKSYFQANRRTANVITSPSMKLTATTTYGSLAKENIN